MDIAEENEIFKRCYQCDQSVLNSLNIVYNASNTCIVLWNKFQIFVYNFEFELDFETAAEVIIPDFQIRRLLLCNNYMVCLDCAGNIQINSLKFKNPSQKRLKTCFQPKAQGVVDCKHYDQEHTISLIHEHNNYFLCLYKINTEFQMEKKLLIICDADYSVQKEDDHLLNSHPVTEDHLKWLKNTFNLQGNVRSNYCFLVMSFDKLNIYGCLINTTMPEDEIKLVKLYSCPSKICSMEICDDNEFTIIVGLTIGTLIKLSLNDLSKKPDVEHLNTAIHKMHAVNNSVIYSDGMSMWKATDIFSERIKFSKFFVNQVKDFIKFGDQLICTTFTNLIYTFQIDDERCFLKSPSTEEYCSVEKVLNNTDCYHKIMEEVKKNDNLVKKLNKDRDYITAISVSNRQDIMDTIITTNVMVYDDYNDTITENIEVKLTEKLVNYYNKESLFFLVNISTAIEHKFSEILSNILGNLKVHLTLSTETKLLKTTSIRITEQLKKTSLLIPLSFKDVDLAQINVAIKILTNVPGAYDKKQITWVVLYRKNITLSSEHFIKSNFNSNRHLSLKEPQESLNELLVQAAINRYGNMFKFIDNSSQNADSKDWSMYVKLPENYKDVLKLKLTSYELNLNSQASNLVKRLSSDEFRKSKSGIIITIGYTKVNIEVEDDGFSNPLLKITSEHVRLLLNLRNFFSMLMYGDFTKSGPGTEFISASFYTSVEYLQRALRDCVRSSSSIEELLPLMQQFERRIMGSIPM